MKKWTSLLLALAMTFFLAACGNSNQENTPGPPASVSGSTTEETPAPTDTETPAEEPTEAPAEESAESKTPTTGNSSSVLIAYFSWSGNTEQVAQIIQQETGGDLFEIAPATPYTDDYNELLDIAQQEQSDNARPDDAAVGGIFQPSNDRRYSYEKEHWQCDRPVPHSFGGRGGHGGRQAQLDAGGPSGYHRA